MPDEIEELEATQQNTNKLSPRANKNPSWSVTLPAGLSVFRRRISSFLCIHRRSR